MKKVNIPEAGMQCRQGDGRTEPDGGLIAKGARISVANVCSIVKRYLPSLHRVNETLTISFLDHLFHADFISPSHSSSSFFCRSFVQMG